MIVLDRYDKTEIRDVLQRGKIAANTQSQAFHQYLRDTVVSETRGNCRGRQPALSDGDG
jgi:hypothetical protein